MGSQKMAECAPTIVAVIIGTCFTGLIIGGMQVLIIATTPTERVYTVGHEDGWSSGYDYQGWAAGRKFYVGDSLIFEYHGRLDSVMQVTERDYRLCITTDPTATYYDSKRCGHDEITLRAPGYYYFISGAYHHCRDGNQKLHVFVNPRHPARAPHTSMSSASSPAPPPPPNSASSNNNQFSYILLVLSAAFLVIVLDKL